MAIAAGSLVGVYRIVAPLGAGGMGEVYRAHDTKLGRDVALKVLPEAFTADPERVARFQREAQALAALNHPNIGGIYGFEQHDAAQFLVLELVDGEGLDARLRAAPRGLPLDEALAIARQIIDALEAAHDRGIIHRDLKPANVMLTTDGQVKVLDFGLAKTEPTSTATVPGLTHSPTLTFAATQAGVILGTAAYMSPEQAKGRPADKRTDVWAFGCVLFELLTGKRAFEGEDVSDTLAAILRGEPDWNALPASVPPHVRAIVTRCLLKDRKVRIPDLSVVRFLLDEPIAPAIQPDTARIRPQRFGWVWKAATALFVLTTIGGLSAWYVVRSAPAAVTRFVVLPPEKAAFDIAARPAAAAAISPDGLKLAFTARDATGKILLWVRRLDSVTAQPLPGTDAAAYPFWSPDSRFIGYSAQAKLMKIAADGGPPQTLCTFSGPQIVGRGGAWNRDGVIVFNNGPGPIHRVAAAGGQPAPAWKLSNGQSSQNFPSFLPDGRHVLFYGTGTSPESAGLFVGSLDTGETKRLLDSDTSAVYAPHAGYLLFVRQGTLLAQTFDPKALALSNEPFPVAERVEAAVIPGIVAFSLSSTGALAYGIGSDAGASFRLLSVDRQGKAGEAIGPPANYRGVDLSPDGQRMAAHLHEGGGLGGDIWVSDLKRGTTSRFTFDSSQDNSSPIWSPGGEAIAFTSVRGGKWGIYRKPSNSAGAEERLAESSTIMLPMSWAPDGRSIVNANVGGQSGMDLFLMPLDDGRKPVAVVQTRFTDLHGQVSPDGKWLAYWSNETGRNEVYVQPFPTGAGKWQVSSNGGMYPRWRRDGRELFFMNQPSNGKMMAVDVKPAGSTFDAGTPKELFDSGYINVQVGHPYHPYAVTADGQRFFIPRAVDERDLGVATTISVVLNWAESLKR